VKKARGGNSNLQASSLINEDELGDLLDDDQDEDDDEQNLQDDGDDDEEDDGVSGHGHGSFHFDYNGVQLRGSRTNCKGHWSKEEVSLNRHYWGGLGVPQV
jgi:hypothetical protein